jgi:hypothetical protein
LLNKSLILNASAFSPARSSKIRRSVRYTKIILNKAKRGDSLTVRAPAAWVLARDVGLNPTSLPIILFFKRVFGSRNKIRLLCSGAYSNALVKALVKKALY